VPVIARVGAYRFFFYSNEGDEPAHVHIQRERMLAKFWLDDVPSPTRNGLRRMS
jgi:hypothetical protein